MHGGLLMTWLMTHDCWANQSIVTVFPTWTFALGLAIQPWALRNTTGRACHRQWCQLQVWPIGWKPRLLLLRKRLCRISRRVAATELMPSKFCRWWMMILILSVSDNMPNSKTCWWTIPMLFIQTGPKCNFSQWNLRAKVASNFPKFGRHFAFHSHKLQWAHFSPFEETMSACTCTAHAKFQAAPFSKYMFGLLDAVAHMVTWMWC
jgi:hypothetical protein